MVAGFEVNNTGGRNFSLHTKRFNNSVALYTPTVISTGISSVTNPEFAVWPNPAYKTLYIDSGPATSVYDVRILSQNGSILINKQKITAHYFLDLSDLPSGSYVVELINRKTGNKMSRIIIKE
jgi:hypothetical protein